jgi:hypothetical protein
MPDNHYFNWKFSFLWTLKYKPQTKLVIKEVHLQKQDNAHNNYMDCCSDSKTWLMVKVASVVSRMLEE